MPPEKVYLRLAGESQALVGDLVAGAGEEVEVECVAGIHGFSFKCFGL